MGLFFTFRIVSRTCDYDAARDASADSRASSDRAVSDGDSESTLTTGSLRISCLPFEVCRITADSRRAIM